MKVSSVSDCVISTQLGIPRVTKAKRLWSVWELTCWPPLCLPPTWPGWTQPASTSHHTANTWAAFNKQNVRERKSKNKCISGERSRTFCLLNAAQGSTHKEMGDMYMHSSRSTMAGVSQITAIVLWHISFQNFGLYWQEICKLQKKICVITGPQLQFSWLFTHLEFTMCKIE